MAGLDASGSFCNICNIMAHLALMLVVLGAIPVYAYEPTNTSPAATISIPSDDSTFYEGDEIPFSGSGNTITLTATDSDGDTGTDSINVIVSGLTIEIEPNNNMAHANSIDSGVSIKGQLSSEKDEDWFSISTSGAGVITAIFNVSNISSGRWNISIEDAFGNVVSEAEYDGSKGAGPTKIFAAITRAGTYYVIIKAYSSLYYGDDNYTLMVSAAQDRLSGDGAVKPWNIVADEISYDQKADQYIARGNVIITKKDEKLSADFVRFDHKTMKAFATGHVIMKAGEDILYGSSMEIDLEAQTGTVYNGTIFLKANHFYIKGNKIQKVGKDSYTVDKASITTCDGDTPAWRITGRNLKVTIEGYGSVNHAALWAKKIPVLYTPFLVFPVKLKRQSGFLPPGLGYSTRNAMDIELPFYWAINESSDATFYEHHIARRGEKIGLEYRYVLDTRSKGTLMYNFLDDSKIDDGTLDSSKKWGYEDDNVLRPNSDRYWFRMKSNQSMPLGFSAKLDIDIVSDQDYLPEFKRGYTGFNKTYRYFEKNFGRPLDDYNDSTRVNRLNLNRTWSNYSLNAEARWYDNVITRRQKERDPTVKDSTLQKLPLVELNASKQPILKSPFYFDLDSEYTHFYRKDGKKGHREDVHPRLYLPLRYRSYFTFEPSFGVRETAWHIYEYEDTSPETDRTPHREIYDIKSDLSTEIYNVYSLDGKGIKLIKHSVRPQIVYDYIPDQEQEKYPNYFDSLDRIGRKNLLTYSITNTFTSRSIKHTKEKDNLQVGKIDKPIEKKERPQEEEIEKPPSYRYRQFFRFKLEQSYDINKANEDDPEPFSLIKGELGIEPVEYLSMNADAEWSQYEDEFQSNNVAVKISDKRGDKLSVERRYTRDSIYSIYTDLLLKISDRLSAYTDYEYNILDDERIRFGLGFLYQAQCWSIELSYTVEENDRRYALMINLFGFGGFGTKIRGEEWDTL